MPDMVTLKVGIGVVRMLVARCPFAEAGGVPREKAR